MVILWALAFASDEAVPAALVPFDPPASVRWFSRVASIEGKGVVSGDDCPAAAKAAHDALIQQARRDGVPTLLAVSARAVDGAWCAQRRTGKTVLQSTVVLQAMAIAELPAGPSVAPAALLPVAAGLGASMGGLDAVSFTMVDDAVCLAWPVGEPTTGSSPGEHGAQLLVDRMLPLVSSWAGPLAASPDIVGACGSSGDAGKRGPGMIRVVVPTSAAAAYLRGSATEFEVAAVSRFAWQAPGSGWVAVPSDSVPVGDVRGTKLEAREIELHDGALDGLEDEPDE